MKNNHEFFMKEALKEAKKAFDKKEVPVGAVLVLDGKVIGRGHNVKEKTNNFLKHAELIAMEKGAKKLKSWRLDDCDLYVTLEPCLMCAGAMTQARIKNLYYGAADLKGGAVNNKINVLNLSHNHKINYESDILKAESEKLLKDFFKTLR